MQPDIQSHTIDKMITAAKRAKHKDVDDLSELERCSIAALCGAEMVYTLNNSGNVDIRTKHMIGIEKVKGVFHVHEYARLKKGRNDG